MLQPSLRLQLVRRLLPTMLALLLCGAGAAYWVAWRSATKAYDRALFDASLAIADQLQVVSGVPRVQLTEQARAVLLTDKFDQIFYAVLGPNGELLDGDPDLPMPPAKFAGLFDETKHKYFSGLMGHRQVRVAALQTERGGRKFTVLVGETLVKRNALVQEILVGMVVPELFLALTCIGVVWFGVLSGLKPLSELKQELAERSHADLSLVQVSVPEEIQPVVNEINGLLTRLEHSLTSQRNFISDAAHQLRNPIAALQAQVEAAVGEPPIGVSQKLNSVLSATYRLAHLVDQMLALARAESCMGQTCEIVHLADVIRLVAESRLPPALAKAIDLGFDLSPAVVNGNLLLLQELLGNLLDNAIRYTPPGGVITVSCGSEGKLAWLNVEDSGSGIPEDERKRVFKRFVQLSGDVREGHGLGLAIVQEIARQHGGEALSRSSIQLGGASFRVVFPMAQID